MKRSELSLPKMVLIEQAFDHHHIQDIPKTIATQIALLHLPERILPGDTVAIGVGSRGIMHIDLIAKAVVDQMKGLGAQPFIIPAMGSHGSATADGQRAVLANYGITEENMGCEIRATMEVVEVGRSAHNTPVFLDAHAASAKHIGVINRVKPHTKLHGEVESGLIKMCLIGLGKHAGAREYHRAIARHTWMEIVQSAFRTLTQRTPLRFGLAIVQNAYEQVAALRAVKPNDFWDQEKLLLQRARHLMGRLPFDTTDLLVVDEMGKEISGTGMDTNITGRKSGSNLKIGHVFVRALTQATHGNAQGIGLSDFTTQRLVDSIDFQALYINSQTAYRTDSCKVPMYFPSDKEVLEVAVRISGITDARDFGLTWIKNTLQLDTVAISELLFDKLSQRKDLEQISDPFEIRFDSAGNLVSPFA